MEGHTLTDIVDLWAIVEFGGFGIFSLTRDNYLVRRYFNLSLGPKQNRFGDHGTHSMLHNMPRTLVLHSSNFNNVNV
jgi:hypothetical protein